MTEFVARVGTPDGAVVLERHRAASVDALRRELETRGLHVFQVRAARNRLRIPMLRPRAAQLARLPGVQPAARDAAARRHPGAAVARAAAALADQPVLPRGAGAGARGGAQRRRALGLVRRPGRPVPPPLLRHDARRRALRRSRRGARPLHHLPADDGGGAAARLDGPDLPGGAAGDVVRAGRPADDLRDPALRRVLRRLRRRAAVRHRGGDGAGQLAARQHDLHRAARRSPASGCCAAG